MGKEKWKGFFSSLKYEILGFEKCIHKLISGFQRGDDLLHRDNTELKKKSSEINFSVTERHRWAVMG